MAGQHDDDMDMTPEMRAEVDALDGAAEARRRQNEPWLKELQDEGWKWDQTDKTRLVHPADPDLFVSYDPYTAELWLSPKQAQLLREEHARRTGDAAREG